MLEQNERKKNVLKINTLAKMAAVSLGMEINVIYSFNCNVALGFCAISFFQLVAFTLPTATEHR